MDNNPFQNWTGGNQMSGYSQSQNVNWNGHTNAAGFQNQGYGGNLLNRSSFMASSNIPVRVVFSPDQIAPQEIPTNGTPAIFPLSDGSCIFVKSLLGNGLFDEKVYVLKPTNQTEPSQPQTSEFDQLIMRLDKIESSLNSILQDLYGAKNQPAQEAEVTKNE